MQQVVPTIVVDAPSLFPNSLTMSFSSKSPEDNIPPNCGQRLLPTTIDEIAECDPHRIFASILRSPTNIEEGYRDVSFHEAAAAINTLAWLLDAELGKSHTFETLAYLAPGDLRYALIAVAAVKVGYKMLFPSPRNSLAAQTNLLERTACSSLITSQPIMPSVADLLNTHSLRILHIPSLAELLDDKKTASYPFTKTFVEASPEPFLVLQTSGSTGLPKPRTCTHGYFAAFDAMSTRGALDDQKFVMRSIFSARMLSTLPAFHAAGLYMSLVYNTFMGTVPVLPPSTGPVSADLVIKLAKYARAEVAFLAPSILEEISQTPELLDQLDSFTKVLFSGGPLPKTAGETVKKRARIINVLGATEFGALLTSEVEQEEWDYLSIHPSSHAELRPHAGGLFELVLVRTKSLELYSPVWHMFPDLQEYPTKDLFTKHPTKPNLWRHAGRADDILVLVNGEKVNPIEMEQCISNHPDVRSALVFGEGHLHCALLIEPNSGTLDSMSDKLGMIESIWPSIQRANSDCPAYARIPKSLVAFTGPGKPMQRAGKGTVQRRQTVMDYQSEMDALYAHEKVLTASDTKPVADLSDEHATRAMMVDLVLHVTEWQDLKEEENFFERGMASSHAVRLAGQLKASTGSELIATSTVYRNPSVISLSAAICSLANQDQITGPDKEGSRIAKMQDSLIKFTEHLNAREPGKVENVDKAAQTILLTGTTGAIGSYLLDALLASRSVARIYCLHREPYGEKRQKHSNSARGLATDWDINRVQFLMCDLTMPMLGLNERTYQEIARCVTLIIHNAWNVNMNLPVSAFKSDIRGTRNLVDLAIDSAAQAEIFFVSSIAAVMGWCHHHNGPVPEETFIDHSVSQATGYAESKQVAERLLQKASQASHVPVTICRVGQIAGPVKHAAGQWNTREWVPSLIASSKHLGMLPATLGKMEYVDWIPIDVLPQIIMELAFTQTKSNTSVNVYHAVNPSKAKWEDFLPVILRQLGHGTKIVSLQEWIQALMKSSAMPDLDLSANPAVKLLDFLSALGDENAPPTPEMQVDNTVEHSRTLKDLGPVNAAWMEKWLHQWGY